MRYRSSILRIFALVLCLFPLSACTTSRSLPEGAIVFEKSNGKKFAGNVHGTGETVIILANMTAGGESQWDPFVEAVDKAKFTVITFNYLQADYNGAAQETLTVLGSVREAGYQRVICIGASLGVTSCGSIAREPEIAGLVLIAGPNYGGTLAGTYPKLFIVGENDTWAYDTGQAYERADEPKNLKVFAGNGIHGTNLFYSDDRDEFLKLLIEFVEGIP